MAEDVELVQYVTRRVVHYLETPREERKRLSTERKMKKEHWSTLWFGMIPLSLSMWAEKRKK